jgi:hypothetical protein
MEQPTKTNRPPGDDFRQQRLKAWQPIMTPWKVIILFIAIGVAFVPTGTTLLGNSNEIYERTIMYDGDDADVDCGISSSNQGRMCSVSFEFNKTVDGPIYVYYELEKFYQNHRRYVSSLDYYQLNGQHQSESDLQTTCIEFITNNSQLMNPCGLIANSMFNDVIVLDTSNSAPAGLSLDESDITWPSDKKKYSQPDGFKSKAVGPNVGSANATICNSHGLDSTCQFYKDPNTNQNYLYFYPDDSSTQYLYETYPGIISPVDGVTNEHFQVWMRPAALPRFRKLYGKVEGDFKEGSRLTFLVQANYEVASFDASKSIVISTIGEFGGKNPYLGVAYIVVGALSLLFGFLFMIKQLVAPRPYADISLLSWD